MDKQFVACRQKDPDRRHRCIRREIMVTALRFRAAFATLGKWANFHPGFGIHRETQYIRRCIRGCIDLVHLLEDGVRFGEFFLGSLLATFWG